MVTGCMCGAVSCQAAETGANVKKKKQPIILRHPPQRDTSQSSNSMNRITSLWVYMVVFKPKVQVEAKVNAGSVVSLTDMMDCVPKCVCVCVCVAVD